MKHTLRNTAKLSGLALAAVAAFTAFGAGNALSAPPPAGPTFASASITIVPRGEAAGGLDCSWREVGLGAFASVTYTCGAQALGVVKGCFVKNKLVANSIGPLAIFKNVSSNEEGHAPEPILAKANGAINGSLEVAIPEAGEGGGEVEACTEPAVEGVVAVRWCNATLVDTTNNIVGATVDELFQEFAPGATVPSCAVLLASPPTP